MIRLLAAAAADGLRARTEPPLTGAPPPPAPSVRLRFSAALRKRRASGRLPSFPHRRARRHPRGAVQRCDAGQGAGSAAAQRARTAFHKRFTHTVQAAAFPLSLTRICCLGVLSKFGQPAAGWRPPPRSRRWASGTRSASLPAACSCQRPSAAFASAHVLRSRWRICSCPSCGSSYSPAERLMCRCCRWPADA